MKSDPKKYVTSDNIDDSSTRVFVTLRTLMGVGVPQPMSFRGRYSTKLPLLFYADVRTFR